MIRNILWNIFNLSLWSTENTQRYHHHSFYSSVWNLSDSKASPRCKTLLLQKPHKIHFIWRCDELFWLMTSYKKYFWKTKQQDSLTRCPWQNRNQLISTAARWVWGSCVFSEASTQQEHEENGAEEDAERAHGGNHNLRHHLHVAYKWIWNTEVRE